YPKVGEYVLVEGVFDQLALTAMGLPSIGFGGSSPSKEQLDDLRDLGEKGCSFVILPDKDSTGLAKAQETVRDLYPYARLASPLEEGKDAADLLAAEGVAGRETVEVLSGEAKDALDLSLKGVPDRGLEKIRHLKDRVLPLVMKLGASEQQAVIKDVASRSGLSQENVRQALAELEATERPILAAKDEDEEELPEVEWAHLLEPGVLDRYVQDATGARGVVGDADKAVVKVITLVAIGAQLAPLPNGKPIGGSIMLTGPAGRGKNYLSDAAVELLPPEWYLSFEVASATVFYYAVELEPAFLKHKFIYPNEAEAVDTVVEFLRPMLSQGRAKKYVTNKNGDGQNAFQELHVEGPITGCIPTVRNKLDDQLQTRMLVVELEEYEGRIQAHTKALSSLFVPDWSAAFDKDLAPRWRAALRSLTAVRKVTIEFANHPGFKLSNEGISHGARLWQNLLGLMCAHALLEQRNREVRNLSHGSRAVVAIAADYEAAHDIFKATSKRSVVNLSDTHRKIVQAVYDLSLTTQFPSAGFSTQKIADEAGISKGTVSKNRAYLTKSVNLLYETEEKRLAISEDVDPSWWAEGNPMEGFPTPAQVRRWEKAPIPPPNGGNGGNKETVAGSPHNYAEKPVSTVGNDAETVFPLFPEQASASIDARKESEIIDPGTPIEKREKDVNDPAAFGELSESEQQELLGWIAATIRPVRRRSPGAYWPSSYQLKHEFERSPRGFYITNGQFKGAMQEAGIAGVDAVGDGINLFYRVSTDARVAQARRRRNQQEERNP
ncbi:MAG TPA: hypothetical protein VHF46_02215, partial [Rubrobacteraceae bacterium]|nr:hypothetical protein [Rubrobacteraceae bacterium]